MGNSGLRKLFFCNQYVETPFTSLYDIPIVTIDKVEESIQDCKGQYSLVVNVGSKNSSASDQLKKLEELVKTFGTLKLLLVPTNSFRNEPTTYQEIKEAYPKGDNIRISSKVEVNGQYTHPLYRFVKRNVEELYDQDAQNGKNIPEDFCKFLISPEGKVLKFYRKDDDFVKDIQQLL